jgi:toxin ParE1/3/4
MKSFSFHPEARLEFRHAAEYYAAISNELGNRFYDEIERLVREISRQPDRFLQFSPPARRALSREFPYLVIYLDLPDRVWIVAVMHGRKKPNYWPNRIA